MNPLPLSFCIEYVIVKDVKVILVHLKYVNMAYKMN